MAIVLAVLSLACCRKEEPLTVPDVTDGRLCFSASAEGYTKAAPAEGLPDSFKIYGATYGTSIGKLNYVYGETIYKDGDKWYSVVTHGKPSSTNYVIYSVIGSGVTVPTSSVSGSSKVYNLTYSNPSSVSDQEDVLVATTGKLTSKNFTGNIGLTFNHILAGVRCSMKTPQDVTVKSVGITNLYVAGTYNVSTGAWTTSGSRTTRTVSLSASVPAGAMTTFMDGGNTLMAVPQTLPSSSVIQVTYNDGKTDHTASMSLSGLVLTKGKMTDVRITLSDDATLRVEAVTLDVWKNTEKELDF